jgi:ribosomal protein L19E
MQSRGVNLGPTGRRRGRGRGHGRKAEVAAPKLVYMMPRKVLRNLINKLRRDLI